MSNKLKFIIIFGVIFVVYGISSILLLNKKVTYEVTFDSNGGTTVSSQIVEKNGKVRVPEVPIRSGYVLVDWELNGKSYNFESPVKENITLVAKWKEKDQIQTFEVIFDSNGGTVIESQNVEEYTTVKKPITPIKEGYVFVEWQLDGYKYDFNLPVTKEITLKAKWKEPATYTITFDSDGGSKINTQNVLEGSKVKKPNDPIKEGFIFNGWYLKGSLYDFNTLVTGNFTLKAKWKELATYTITFDSDGGSKINTQNVLEGSKVKKPNDPIKEGFIFNGWYLKGSLYDFNTLVTGNFTLKAKWNTPPNEDLIKAQTISSNIDKLNIKFETLNEDIMSKINVIEGCNVVISNMPSSIERGVTDKTIKINFSITCSKETISKEKDAIVVASPYKYTKVMNSNMLNYDVTVNGSNWNGNAKLFLGDSGSFNVIDRKAIVEINKIESNPTFLMKFNDNSKVIYHVPFNG